MEQLSLMALADDISRLYQLPLGEFTAAKNALAKRASPADKLHINLAHKPTVPAWAVNQLFWRKRKVFDRLIDAARRLRVEHGRQLSGRQADVTAADRAHQDVLKSAAEEIRKILTDAGETDSPQTMGAVVETLQGLPGRDDYGRLTKPLKPQGFEALAGLVKGGATVARLAAVKPPAPPPAKGAGARTQKIVAAEQKREAEARKKARAAAERELKLARVAERNCRADFARVEMQLARAERERKDLQARIDETIARRDQMALELDRARKALERATGDRERLERITNVKP